MWLRLDGLLIVLVGLLHCYVHPFTYTDIIHPKIYTRIMHVRTCVCTQCGTDMVGVCYTAGLLIVFANVPQEEGIDAQEHPLLVVLNRPTHMSATHLHRYMARPACVGMCVGMYVGTYIGTCVDMCVDMCTDMYVGTYVDMCRHMNRNFEGRVDGGALVWDLAYGDVWT